MSLQKPPSDRSGGGVVGKFIVLVLMGSLAGIAVYSAVLSQRADLTEDIRLSEVELADKVVVDGITLNLAEVGEGPPTVVLLHDAEVTGMISMSDLASSLAESYRVVRIDLPGFGLSSRVTSESPLHTVSGMAALLAEALDVSSESEVLVAGVGLGGEVAAELALTDPDLVSGLVLIDVDFESSPAWPQSLQSLPGIGKAAVYTWETGGRFALDEWAPHCEQGGWCPDEQDLAARSTIVEIAGTTDSMYAFRRTPEAALAGTNLGEISVPIAYVRSSRGDVDESALSFVRQQVATVTVVESDAFAAHLEDFDAIGAAISSVAG